MRPALLGLSLIVVGAQVVFGSFFISVLRDDAAPVSVATAVSAIIPHSEWRRARFPRCWRRWRELAAGRGTGSRSWRSIPARPTARASCWPRPARGCWTWAGAPFGHGSARNRAAAAARGEVLLFLTQDVEPVGDGWLAPLLDALSDARVAGVFGRQVPRGASPEETFLARSTTPAGRAASRRGPAHDLRPRHHASSRAPSAWCGGRLGADPVPDIVMSEDQAWAMAVLRPGYEIRYEPSGRGLPRAPLRSRAGVPAQLRQRLLAADSWACGRGVERRGRASGARAALDRVAARTVGGALHAVVVRGGADGRLPVRQAGAPDAEGAGPAHGRGSTRVTAERVGASAGAGGRRAEARRAFSNAGLNLVASVLPFPLALVTVPAVIRGFGVERYGVLATAGVVLAYFGLLDLGLGRASTRFLARSFGEDTDDATAETFWTVTGLAAAIGLAAGALLLAVAAPLARHVLRVPAALVSDSEAAFQALALAAPFVVLLPALLGALEARRRFDLVAAISVPTAALGLLAPLGVLPWTTRLMPVMLVIAAVQAAACAVTLAVCLRVLPGVRRRVRLRLGVVGGLVGYGRWVAVSNVVGPLMVNADRLVIGSVMSVRAVSYYAAPFDLVTRMSLVPASVMRALFPLFSADRSADVRDARRLAVDGARVIALIMGPAAALIVGPGARRAATVVGTGVRRAVRHQPPAAGGRRDRQRAGHGPVLAAAGAGSAGRVRQVPSGRAGDLRPDAVRASSVAGDRRRGRRMGDPRRPGLRVAAGRGAPSGRGRRAPGPHEETDGVRRRDCRRAGAGAPHIRERRGGGGQARRRDAAGGLHGRTGLAAPADRGGARGGRGRCRGAPAAAESVAVVDQEGAAALPLEPAGPCPVCGETRRRKLYDALRDWLGGASGSWSFQRCHGCGLLLLDPRLPRADIGLAYSDYEHHLAPPAPEPPSDPRANWGQIVLRAYRRHAYGYPDELPRWLRTLARLAVPYPEGAEAVGFSVMYLRPVPGGDLLDVGCGGGAQMVEMRKLGWRVTGVDPDERAVEMATRSHGLDVRRGTLEEQRFPSDRFDAVTLSHVIEHVHDPVGLLRECGRVLKPGGRLVVVTPNTASLGHRRLGVSWIGLQPPRHLYLFTCGTLRRLVERVGLSTLTVRSSVRNAEFTWLLGRGLLKAWPSPGQRPPRGWAGRRARGFQLAEWVLTWWGMEAGEEIVLVATKA